MWIRVRDITRIAADVVFYNADEDDGMKLAHFCTSRTYFSKLKCKYESKAEYKHDADKLTANIDRRCKAFVEGNATSMYHRRSGKKTSSHYD